MTTIDGMFQSLVGRIPNWVGFGLIILAGLTSTVMGVVTHHPGFISFGVAAIASAVLAWISGGRSSPQISPGSRSFGGTVKNIDGVVWLVIVLLFVAAVVVAVIGR